MFLLFYTWLILVLFTDSENISFHRPKLSSCAQWNSHGIVFPLKSDLRFEPGFIFIDRNNTIYVTYPSISSIYIWYKENIDPDRIISITNYQPNALFVSSIGDIYVGNEYGATVEKWTTSIADDSETIANYCSYCRSLFIDINDILYCSMFYRHQVIAKSLHSDTNIITIVAGVGRRGSKLNMLSDPEGIYVHINRDLYVADSVNNRVLLFHPGEIIGKIIIDSSDPINIWYPIAVLLDENENIYIIDHHKNRIIGSSPNGFRCLVGCIKFPDSSLQGMAAPQSMAFDSDGNMYIVDRYNYRILKFLLTNDTCNKFVNLENSTTETTTSTEDTLMLIESVYTSVLTLNHLRFPSDDEEPCCFFETIPLHVFEDGKYTFLINTTMFLIINLYHNEFNARGENYNDNRLLRHYGGCEAGSLEFTFYLLSGETYVLVPISLDDKVPLPFSLIITGPGSVTFSRLYTTAVQSTYSSELTNNSSQCKYLPCEWLHNYCESIQIEILQPGYYTVVSSSFMDMYGFLYDNKNEIYAFNLFKNSIKFNDNGYDSDEFRISINVDTKSSFRLVVTTKHANEQGVFFIIIIGPNVVSMKQHTDLIPQVIQFKHFVKFRNVSQKFKHHDCEVLNYYEFFRVNVTTTGYYIFSIDLDNGINGYLYRNNFNPYQINENLLSKNGYQHCKSIGNRYTIYLQSDTSYIFLMTMSRAISNVSKLFPVSFEGPDQIHMEGIDILITLTSTIYSILLTKHSHQYKHDHCMGTNFYATYTDRNQILKMKEWLQINVVTSGIYSLLSQSMQITYGLLYKFYFNPYNPSEHIVAIHQECHLRFFQITTELQANTTYVLVINTFDQNSAENISIYTSGPNNITFNRIILQQTYQSELTMDTPMYSRHCLKGNYHYETLQITVDQNGSYIFNANSSIMLYGYIYQYDFDPFSISKNIIKESNSECCNTFAFGIYLQMNIAYILLITTYEPNIRGNFTVFVSGPKNITLNRIVKKQSTCVIGDYCSLYRKGIGLTINDILNNQIKSDIPFYKQSSLVQAAAGITMIMCICGFINGVLSLITFQDKNLRKVGCAIYLLGCSINSLVIITIFTIKFWLVTLIQLYSITSSSILRFDCVFIGPILKICLYFDGWLNACVAIERIFNVSKGVNFDKTKSIYIARSIIILLPIIITLSIIHQPIQHHLHKYTTYKYTLKYNNSTSEYQSEPEHRVICVARYSSSLQIFDTFILFFHFTVPFLVNLFSACFIILNTARQRFVAKNQKGTFKQYILKQLHEHKQLIISPIILLTLAWPRLIISLLSGCVDPSINPWLYLSAYFISFVPSMLLFAIFVLPSELYTTTFKQTIRKWRQRMRRQ